MRNRIDSKYGRRMFGRIHCSHVPRGFQVPDEAFDPYFFCLTGRTQSSITT